MTKIEDLERRIAALEEGHASTGDKLLEDAFLQGTADGWIAERLFSVLVEYLDAIVPAFEPKALRAMSEKLIADMYKGPSNKEAREAALQLIAQMIPA